MTISFSRATIADVDAYIDIEKKVESRMNVVTTDRTEALQEMEEAVVHLIKKNNVVVGLIAYKRESADCAYISELAILPDFQGKGIGYEALAYVLEELKDVKLVYLATHPHNVSALKLYFRFGFVIESWKDNCMGDGEPRLILVRALVQSSVS